MPISGGGFGCNAGTGTTANKFCGLALNTDNATASLENVPICGKPLRDILKIRSIA